MPNEADLLANYCSLDENLRQKALATLEKEIHKQLRHRKVPLGEHDVNNVARHTVEQMIASGVTKPTWGELVELAKTASVPIAAEEIRWLRRYEQLHEETVRVLRSKFGRLTYEDLNSIAHDAFVRAREKYPKLIKDPKALRNTLFEIARNAAKDELKARKAGKRDEDKLQHFEDMSASHGDEGDADAPKYEPSDRDLHPSDALLDKEKKHTLWQAISKMPKKHAQIFMDLHFHRMKHHEVAEKYGLKIGSIGVYNKRAAEMLLVAVAGSLGLFMLMFRYFFPAHGPAATMANNQTPGGAGGTNSQMARQKPNKPHFTVQFAEIFVGEELMRGGTVTVTNNPSFSPQVVQKIQATFGTNSPVLSVNSDNQSSWTTDWSAKGPAPAFKVVYDTDHQMLTVLADEAGKSVPVMSLHVANEAAVEAALPAIQDAITEYLKKH